MKIQRLCIFFNHQNFLMLVEMIFIFTIINHYLLIIFVKDLVKYIIISTQIKRQANTKISIDFEEFYVLLFNKVLKA